MTRRTLFAAIAGALILFMACGPRLPGVEIDHVEVGSPAYLAGLREHDRATSCNGISVYDDQDLDEVARYAEWPYADKSYDLKLVVVRPPLTKPFLITIPSGRTRAGVEVGNLSF